MTPLQTETVSLYLQHAGEQGITLFVESMCRREIIPSGKGYRYAPRYRVVELTPTREALPLTVWMSMSELLRHCQDSLKNT